MKITQHAKTWLDVANAVLEGNIYSCKYYLAIKKNEVLIPNYMDEPWKYYARWKKLITKDHRLYDSSYIKCPE